MPKVSFIVPIYNAEKCIQRCLDSILAQSFNDFELILINDGSKDNSDNICLEYEKKDNRIKYIYQENKGVSAARNHGIEVASGRWISFIDSDDYIEPGYCDSINEAESCNADLIINNVKILKEGNEINQCYSSRIITNPKESIAFWEQNLMHQVCAAPWAKFFSRQIIQNHALRFNEKIYFKEDILYNLCFLGHITTVFVSGDKASQYIYNSEEQIIEYKKYKCTAQSMIIMRDSIVEQMNALNMHHIIFERFLFFLFQTLEHRYLGESDDVYRRQFYRTDMQNQLEKKYLRKFRIWDQWMYLAFKYVPHSLISPIARIYLHYR